MTDSDAQPDIHVVEAGYVDSDEGVPMAEKDLAEDAQWKIIQKNTFTRWVKEHLKKANMDINDLETDFSDGLRLAALIEVLTQHKFKQINKKPTFRTQKLENVTTVLNYIEEVEGLKLVSIDSSHIVDCNLKLILGLVWTLIMHYSISLPMWDGEDDRSQEDKGAGPKQRLLSWITGKIPEASVKNFTTDWNSGIAIGALVDSCAPGLCPDWSDWDSRQPLRNATEAMTTAEEWLSVPQLIRPEEMVNPNVDEKAMMTYISQFPNAKLKEGAPLRLKRNPANVKAYGPGLETTGNTLGKPCNFTVETANAGSGQLEVIVLNPKGIREPCNVVPNRDQALSYSCNYEPRMDGEHRIIVKFAGQEIPRSPFRVNIEGPAADPSKVMVTGPGVDKLGKNCVGRRTHFNVNAQNAGKGVVECAIIDPSGRRDTIKPRISRPEGDAVYLVEYTPKEPGTHQVLVYFAGQQIPDSPFTVPVNPPFNPNLVYVTGRGVQAHGIRAQDEVTFFVHTERAGEEAPVKASMVRADGATEIVRVDQTDKHLWSCSYVPQRPGRYTIRVLYGNSDIQGSPFDIVVGPYKKCGITAFGRGLYAGVVNRPNIFTVCCREESSKIGFSIEGPSEANVDCFNNGDGTASVSYTVSQPGEYAVHILYENEDIPNSPYMPNIHEDTDGIHPERVRIYGPGVETSKTSLVVGKPVEFYIEGLADAVPPLMYRTINDTDLESVVRAECHDAHGNPVPMRVYRRSDGTVVFMYTPTSIGVHTISTTVGDIPLQGCPFRVQVVADIQPEKVKVWGPGLKNAVFREPTHFFIDPREAFQGEQTPDVIRANPLAIRATDSHGHPVSVKMSKQPDGIYRAEYTLEPGMEEIIITPMLGGVPTCRSPLRVFAQPSFDPRRIKIVDLDSRVFKASYVKFVVDASAIDPAGQGMVSAILCAPDHERLACQVQNNHDGTYTCSYTPLEEGLHQIEVSYEGVPLPGSPFDVRVVPGCDPSRIKAFGPGLLDSSQLTPGTKTHFTVDLTGAGQGGLGLAVEGPSEAPIECQDNRDGTCTVFYTPTEPGAYAIFVKFNDINVPNSPFKVDVKAKVDPGQVQCYGPGLESGLLRAGWPAYFTVDTKKAGDARLQVMYSPKPGAELRPAIIQPLGTAVGMDPSQPQHYHKITYTPEAEGLCQIEVKFDGCHVPGSPFAVQIRKSCEPERVKVMGAGVEGPALASLPVSFTVDARDAGMGDLTLGLTDPKGQSVPVRVVPLSVDNESVMTNGAVPSVTSLASGDVSDTGLLSCTYEPYMVGPHVIHVMFAGVEVENSPFTVQCAATGRADKCQIRGEVKEALAVGEEHVITVNTSLGGKGRLTCQVVQQPPDQSPSAATLLPVETEDNRDGTTSVYYTPTQTGQLQIELRYGGQLIPNGEFTQKVVTQEEMDELNKPAVVYRPVEFRLPSPRDDVEIESIVVRPSGAQQPVPYTINDDDTITITYDPIEQGMHELHVNTFSAMKSGDVRQSLVAMPLQGSPYRFYVDNVAPGRVTAYGPGLSHGLTNQPAKFTIVTKEAGGGGLSLSVEGPSKAEITCHENGDGTCSVSYLPLSPGQYNIAIKFLNQHIAGSPFTAKITGDVVNRAQLSVGAPSDIALEAFSDDISTLTASVRSISGREEPCVLKRLPNNRLGISFTPKEVGEHLISVFQSGQHIANSPFRIRISEKEIGDPSRVVARGPGLISGFANQPNQFTVDTRDAGYAGLSLSVEGPSKAEIECQDNHDGTCSVIYTPTEPGPYVINVKYADMHVPNSPFYVDIGGEASTRITERITRRREASSVTNVGSRCELSLRVSDTNPRDMTASVTSPSGKTTTCEIVPVDADHYTIKFIPQEMGEHLVTVKHRGINIAGSPFQFTVGPITDGVAHKVRAVGPGLQQGTTEETNEFTIYTREAGAGTLAIAIEGPSKADIECEERRDGSSVVFYRVSLPGVYTCSLKFNDEHIPFSPFRIYVSDSTQADRIASYTLQSQYASAREITSTEDITSQVGRPIAFTVHHEEQPSEVLKATVQAPSGVLEDVMVQPIDRDQFAVRFVPHESGTHLVYVHSVPAALADQPDLPLGATSPYRPIQGSPFRLVITHQAADPGKVKAEGEGLRRGKVGAKNTFFVNTSNAGSGVLNVTVDGPSKVILTTKEQEDGYLFTYVPPVPGIYDITIKYGGNYHIVGSPFKAEITGSPRSASSVSHVSEHQSNVILETVDRTTSSSLYHASEINERRTGAALADRVRCHGKGLTYAEIENVNYFNVDASEAGSEMLLVGIYGPTRPFEEVKVKHLGNNQYSVSYLVNEPGRHWLLVKWGDRHVPGSPFVVDVPKV